MSLMEIIPAIDLLAGNCVRLRKGNYNKSTQYSNDPLYQIEVFLSQGATTIHLVDLDGARTGSPAQFQLIRKLIARYPDCIQVGGGIRSWEHCQDYLNLEVKRLVLGSALVSSRKSELLSKFMPMDKSKLVAALDFRLSNHQAFISTDGWKRSTSVQVSDAISFLLAAGVTTFLCTDIDRDGMLEGPASAQYQAWIEEFPQIKILASGGISSLDDLTALRKIGVHGAILGKSLYERRIELKTALESVYVN